MPITVVISQSQSKNPAKRQLEGDIVAALLTEPGIDVTVVPDLYHLTPDGTGILCLQGISGDMILCTWLYPRAAHWTLDRHGIHGQVGETLLASLGEDEDDEAFDEEPSDEEADDQPRVAERREPPGRTIYCLDLRAHESIQPYIAEIRRIAAERATQTVELTGWIDGAPKPEQLDRYLQPTGVEAAPTDSHGNGRAAAAEPKIVAEDAPRRWYPVIDYSRCTNCLECIDFCLFGVYGVDRVDTILVEQPDNCRKGCPACSRVCPENAIIFPQHKSPAIAGSSVKSDGLKIDLSQLFGAPDENPLDAAVRERDEQLVLAGRDAVGTTLGIPKRQADKPTEPKDELDNLIDQLDELDL